LISVSQLFYHREPLRELFIGHGPLQFYSLSTVNFFAPKTKSHRKIEKKDIYYLYLMIIITLYIYSLLLKVINIIMLCFYYFEIA